MVNKPAQVSFIKGRKGEKKEGRKEGREKERKSKKKAFLHTGGSFTVKYFSSFSSLTFHVHLIFIFKAVYTYSESDTTTRPITIKGKPLPSLQFLSPHRQPLSPHLDVSFGIYSVSPNNKFILLLLHASCHVRWSLSPFHHPRCSSMGYSLKSILSTFRIYCKCSLELHYVVCSDYPSLLAQLFPLNNCHL